MTPSGADIKFPSESEFLVALLRFSVAFARNSSSVRFAGAFERKRKIKSLRALLFQLRSGIKRSVRAANVQLP